MQSGMVLAPSGVILELIAHQWPNRVFTCERLFPPHSATTPATVEWLVRFAAAALGAECGWVGGPVGVRWLVAGGLMAAGG